MQRQPFRPGEAVVHPFEQPFEQVVRPQRRAIGEYPARLGGTEVADIPTAGDALRLRVEVEQDVPTVISVDHPNFDFVGVELAPDRPVDPGEGELLHRVGPLA